MATGSKGGFGTKIYRDDGTGTFVALPETLDINGPELTLTMEDATNSDSVNGRSEKIPVGTVESGDVTFQMHLLPANTIVNALYDDLNTKSIRNWRIVYPGATVRLAFTGYVSKIGHAYPLKNKMVQDIAITPTGPISKEQNS